MANAAAATASDSDPQPKIGKSRKMLIAGAIAALLALGGGGAYYFLAHKAPTGETKAGEAKAPDTKAADTKAADTKAAEKTPRKPMVYLPLDTFTVNLHHADEERYLQVTINLELADAATAESLKQQMPSIRNRVLLLLSSKSPQDLMPRDGKEKLAVEITEELRKTLDGAGPNKGLEQVLFSSFVIQ